MTTTPSASSAAPTMKAWLLPALTGVSSLKLAAIPVPVAGPDEVVLALHFASLNPADRYLAEAQYPARPTFPHILGRDGVGTVLEVGSNVTTFKPGDTAVLLRSEVGVNRPGTFAQRVAVPASNLVPLPSHWTEPQAAAAPLVYLTAYQALTQFTDPPLPSPATILITGASGGVGVASIQLAKAMNHANTIIALSRSPEKANQLRALGATHAADPTDRLWSKKLRETLGKARVDLAIDNIGGSLLAEVIDCLGMNGRVSLVGRLAGPVPSFNTAALFFRRIRLGGVAVGTYSPQESQAAWQHILALLAPTDTRPLIDHIFPFEQLPLAFDRLAIGPLGKVLLQIPQ